VLFRSGLRAVRIGSVLPSLEGRRFAPAARTELGEAGVDTVFEYHEDEGIVWARYEGGDVRLGFLVGIRVGDRLEFRYCHLSVAGETADGTCRSEIMEGDGSGLVLHESWQWDSRAGRGTSILRELR
jgi:hypothetical protein